MKHTPEPWRWEEYLSPKGMFFVRGPNGEHIVGGPVLTNEANAKLIAAAPEMACALKPFVLAAEDIDDDELDNRSMWEHPASMNLTVGDFRNAMRALAKGEDQ